MPSSYVSGRVIGDQTEHSRAIIVGYVPSGHYFAEMPEMRLSRKCAPAEFVTGLERLLGRPIARRSPGPKPVNRVDGEQLELLQ
jgi:hypothetical protein